MKTLLVLRHAKSSWDYPELSDFDRPLSKRGEAAAPFMGELMNSKGLEPDLIVSSPAKRARTTAEKAADAGGFEAPVELDERIYGAGANTLAYIIAGFDDGAETAMIVGHNPGFEDLVGALTGERPRFPTAALAVIDLDISVWSETESGKGRLRNLYIPKEEMDG